MFTGIVQGQGTVTWIRPSGSMGKHLGIEADFDLDRMKIGDSIAVNGACFTAVSITGRRFEVDISSETLKTTIFGKTRAGDRVNLERAVRLGDRIDGHLVTGHVDGTGIVQQQIPAGNALLIRIGVPDSLARYMVQKGSVAVDGISLTINGCDRNSFEVMIIPHTAKQTTLCLKKPGDAVNIETDLIGKYVERFVTGRPGGFYEKREGKGSPGIDRSFLSKTGFL